MNVLSLFDGMSCGRVALERCGFWLDNYFASEIDKYAIQVAKKNFPDTQHIGDVTKVFGKDLPQIDILIGGSPCQGFSFAGKQLNFEDPRSKLFFEFVRLNEECKPKYFFLENVKMKKEHQDVISKYLGVEPIELNSSLVSAQNRKRLYWTNIPGYEVPEDKGILLKDIIDVNNNNKNHLSSNRVLSLLKFLPKGFKISGKSPTLTTEIAHGSGKNAAPKIISEIFYLLGFYRMLTPIECERLQTVPDNYTEGVSNSQRYKMLGNGWTVDAICEFFKNIPQDLELL